MGNTLDGFPDFFQTAVTQLLAACPGSSVGSGSRTSAEQAALVASKGLWSPSNPGAAPVGTSNHEVGVGSGAADLSGDMDCLHANAGRFGLHFPISNEPWHIEPTDELIQAGDEFFGTDPAAVAQEEDMGTWLERLVFGQQEDTNAMEGVNRELDEQAAPVAAEAAPAAFTPEASAGFSSGEGGAMSAIDVARVYAQAGFTGDALVTMVAIARGESGWNPGAQGDTSITTGTWGPSIGLSQIRSLNAQAGTGGWRDPQRLADPLFNARAAYAISNGGTNFQPWTVYSADIYQQYVAEARAAVSALGAGAVGGTGPPAASIEPEVGAIGPDVLSDPLEMADEISQMVLASSRGSTVAGLEDVKAAKNEEDLADA